MGIKSTVFSLLPEGVQHRIILRKTGHRFVANAPLTSRHSSDFFLPPKSQTWEKRLASPYGHEPEIVRWFERNLRQEDVVFDVGAHMGFYGVLLNRIAPGISFHGFEGNWFIAAYQRMNRDHLGMQRSWHIVEKLAGPTSGGAFIAIDDYVHKNQHPTIFLMDVDGEEISVMAGAGSLLDRAQTTFLVEVHPKDLAVRGKTVDEFLAFFDTGKYHLRYLPQLRSQAARWSEVLDEVTRQDEFYLLACPNDQSRF